MSFNFNNILNTASQATANAYSAYNAWSGKPAASEAKIETVIMEGDKKEKEKDLVSGENNPIVVALRLQMKTIEDKYKPLIDKIHDYKAKEKELSVADLQKEFKILNDEFHFCSEEKVNEFCLQFPILLAQSYLNKIQELCSARSQVLKQYPKSYLSFEVMKELETSLIEYKKIILNSFVDFNGIDPKLESSLHKILESQKGIELFCSILVNGSFEICRDLNLTSRNPPFRRLDLRTAMTAAPRIYVNPNNTPKTEDLYLGSLLFELGNIALHHEVQKLLRGFQGKIETLFAKKLDPKRLEVHKDLIIKGIAASLVQLNLKNNEICLAILDEGISCLKWNQDLYKASYENHFASSAKEWADQIWRETEHNNKAT